MQFPMQAIVDRIDKDMVIMYLLPEKKEAVLISTTLIPGITEGDLLDVDIRPPRKHRPVVKPDATAFLRELRKRL